MKDLLSVTPSIDDLGERFVQHISALNGNTKLADSQSLWQDVAEHYNETARTYHTLRHVQQLFTQFNQVKHCLDDPNILALALYYHDVVYDPTRSDNEAKSAEYAVAKLGRYLSTKQCTQAVRQEYAHVDINAYRNGRIAVLEGLLAYPRLYLTEYYHDRLEQQARQNIQCEIKSLRVVL